MSLSLYKRILIIICIIFCIHAGNVIYAQGSGGPTPPANSLSFALKSNPTADFVFNTYNEYITGITKFNVLTLNIVAGVRWDLYVRATTVHSGYWDNIMYYSGSSGVDSIPLSVLLIRASNADNTSNTFPTNTSVFFPITANTSPTYLIGTDMHDNLVSCGIGDHTNAPGSYITSPGCYKFNIDFRVVPAIHANYRPGIYSINVEFTLIQDL
jgi:hypothetical protein